MGDHLSGEISRLDTADITRKFDVICDQNNIEVDLLDVYVDDADSVMGVIPYGHYWNGKELLYDQARITEDEKTPDDAFTVNIMVAISNSIQDAIQWEGDCGSNHEDGRIPVLDLKLEVIYIQEPANIAKNIPAFEYPQVSFTFYRKPMARSTIMSYDSAMPEGTKRLNAVNELLRRLMNTTPDLPNTKIELTKATNEYMKIMKNSGYSERYRRDTILDAYRGYKKKLENAVKDNTPLFRTKEDGARGRYNSKILVKSNWFKQKPRNSKRKTRRTPNH
mgnify:CR=1 FL=1